MRAFDLPFSRPLRAALRVLLAGSAALLVAAVAAAVPAPLAAQAPATAPADTLYEVRLVDGSTLVGRLVAEEGDLLTFETTAGIRIQASRAQIASMTVARGQVVNGAFWREDPNRTRLLLLSPTGRSLRQGEGYLSSFWIFFPFVGYGITDEVTLAAGTPLIPGVIGRVVYIAPKVRVLEQQDLSVSVGTLSLFATEELASGSGGIVYGVGTFGSPDRSISAGAGWLYVLSDRNSELSNQPAIMLGGELRTGARTKLLTENFFVPGEAGALVSGGMRFFGERLSADFGLAAVVGLENQTDGRTPWFPVLNFVYNFGGSRR
jgi:hypothetical protein